MASYPPSKLDEALFLPPAPPRDPPWRGAPHYPAHQPTATSIPENNVRAAPRDPPQENNHRPNATATVVARADLAPPGGQLAEQWVSTRGDLSQEFCRLHIFQHHARTGYSALPSKVEIFIAISSKIIIIRLGILRWRLFPINGGPPRSPSHHKIGLAP